MSAEDWEAEKVFWERHKTTKCYDLEHDGGYLGSSSMVEQDPDKIPGQPGDYVKAEDYRRVVEALEKRIAELEQQAEMACVEPSPNCGCSGCAYSDEVHSKKGESDGE